MQTQSMQESMRYAPYLPPLSLAKIHVFNHQLVSP